VDQGGGFAVLATTLAGSVEVSNFGLPGQVIRTTWFDRLATDYLLGIWITAMIILGSLWLEAVFPHVTESRPEKRTRAPVWLLKRRARSAEKRG